MPPITPGSDHCCFIIHDNLPYCYDINSILALPAGFRYRNRRFRKAWVEGNLHDHIDAMVGSDVLIFFFRLQKQNQLSLIPVRWGRHPGGTAGGSSIYWFEYTLGDLVAYPDNADECQAGSGPCHETVRRHARPATGN